MRRPAKPVWAGADSLADVKEEARFKRRQGPRTCLVVQEYLLRGGDRSHGNGFLGCVEC